jgi:hypothetical protein
MTRAHRHSRAAKIASGISLSFGWILVVFVVPSFFRPFDCPSATLVSGHLNVGNALLMFGAGLSCLALLLSMFGYGARSIPPAKRQQYRRIGVIGYALVAASLLMWLDGLFTYYCATSQEIVVHPGPFEQTVTYDWTGVKGVSTGCFTTRGGTSIEFNLEMKDGRRIGLGGDTWPTLAANYAQIVAALASVPYAYDNQHTEECPASYRQRFARRPS